MNKNIRRSIVMAAGVTGAWALGSAVASADELAASSLSAPDPTADASAAVDTGDTAGSLTGAVTGTVDGTVSGVQNTVSGITDGSAARGAGTTVSDTAGRAASKAGALTGTAATTARHATSGGAEQARRYVDAEVGTARAGAVRGAQAIQGAHAARAAKAGATALAHGTAAHAGHVTDRAAGMVSGTSAPQDAIDYLFGPLSAFAPEVEEALAGAQSKLQATQAAARSRVHGVDGVVRTKAQHTIAGAGRTATDVTVAAQAHAAHLAGA
ncbi:hypothetical protein ACF1A5_01695, partial [Streptomyces sp. NPDC014864]